MIQLKNAGNVAQALSAMVQAAVMTSADGQKLTALVQQQSSADDENDDLAPGAPDAAVYESKSGGIVDTLESLLEKAEEQLAAAQKKETSAKHNFEMLEQSLNDQIKNG